MDGWRRGGEGKKGLGVRREGRRAGLMPRGPLGSGPVGEGEPRGEAGRPRWGAAVRNGWG